MSGGERKRLALACALALKPKMMFIETDKISVNSIMDIIPDDYIVLCSDGMNTMFILEDFYKGPFVGKVNH